MLLLHCTNDRLVLHCSMLTCVIDTGVSQDFVHCTNDRHVFVFLLPDIHRSVTSSRFTCFCFVSQDGSLIKEPNINGSITH